MCPLAACWTCYPRDLNMALAMTTQIKGFNSFFQETGASKLANAERGCLLDGPSLYHPTTQIFWLHAANMDLSAGHGWRIEYYMSGQFRKGSAAGSSECPKGRPSSG